jgi:hypothetical protein
VVYQSLHSSREGYRSKLGKGSCFYGKKEAQEEKNSKVEACSQIYIYELQWEWHGKVGFSW